MTYQPVAICGSHDIIRNASMNSDWIFDDIITKLLLIFWCNIKIMGAF